MPLLRRCWFGFLKWLHLEVCTGCGALVDTTRRTPNEYMAPRVLHDESACGRAIQKTLGRHRLVIDNHLSVINRTVEWCEDAENALIVLNQGKDEHDRRLDGLTREFSALKGRLGKAESRATGAPSVEQKAGQPQEMFHIPFPLEKVQELDLYGTGELVSCLVLHRTVVEEMVRGLTDALRVSAEVAAKTAAAAENAPTE